MMGWLLVIHSIVAAALVVVVLLQRSEKSALGSLGGGDFNSGVFAARSTANLLTRVTAFLATIFIVLALLLSYLSTREQQPQSLFDSVPSNGDVSTTLDNPGVQTSDDSGDNVSSENDSNVTPSPLPELTFTPNTSDSDKNNDNQ